MKVTMSLIFFPRERGSLATVEQLVRNERSESLPSIAGPCTGACCAWQSLVPSAEARKARRPEEPGSG